MTLQEIEQRIQFVTKLEGKAIKAKNKVVVKKCMDRINELEKLALDKLM